MEQPNIEPQPLKDGNPEPSSSSTEATTTTIKNEETAEQPSQQPPPQPSPDRPPQQQRRPRKPRQPLVPPTQHEDWINVTPDGGIKKHIVVPATDPRDLKRTPNEGSKVRISYSSKLEGGHVMEDLFRLKQERVFVIGAGTLPVRGVDMVLLTMHKGETADVRIAFPYGHAAGTMMDVKLISKNSPVVFTQETVQYFTIRLVSYDRKKNEPASFEERLDFIEEDRELGNDQFKNFNQAPKDKAKSHLDEALKCYNRALGLVVSAKLENESDENIKRLTGHAVAIHSNMALVYYKIGDDVKCIESVEKALEGDPDHAKSIYRRGMAQMRLCKWEEAERDFCRALELAPNDAAVKASLTQLAAQQRNAEKKTDKFFKNMFNSSSGGIYEDAEPSKSTEYDEYDTLRNQGRQVWYGSDDNVYVA